MNVATARTAEIAGIRNVREGVCGLGERGRTRAEIFAGNVANVGAGGGRGCGSGGGGEEEL